MKSRHHLFHDRASKGHGSSPGFTPICIAVSHSRSQRPRSFWSAPRIATSGPLQRHSSFEWLCEYNRLRSEPIRFLKLYSEHAQIDGKSVNRGLPVLDMARGRDSWCWPKGARPLGTRMRSKHECKEVCDVKPGLDPCPLLARSWNRWLLDFITFIA